MFEGRFEWADDDRLLRYRGPFDPTSIVELVPVYDEDGTMIAIEQMLVGAGGVARSWTSQLTFDQERRIATFDDTGGSPPLRYAYEYDEERLGTVVRTSVTSGNMGRETYAYTTGGRLARYSDNLQVFDISWQSATTAVVTRSVVTGGERVEVQVTLDDAGQLVGEDVHVDGRRRGVLAWDRDGAGRLVEFWFDGDL